MLKRIVILIFYKYIFPNLVIYLGWFSIFDNGTTQFTIAYSLFMLVVDSAILCFLIFYIDSVFPTDGSAKKHPLFLFEVIFCIIFTLFH